MSLSAEPIRVLVTGAAGQIAYSLVPMIAAGLMFGESQPLILHLLDIPPAEKALGGVVMELEDCAFPLLRGVVATSNVEEAFTKVDYAILVGAMPRREGMQRADLLKANCGIFKEQGKALNDFASKNAKVLVVGNPANTNALITLLSAPDLPKENFSALTRLDQNRARGLIARRAQVDVTDVQNVIIWGNHSLTQFPDVAHATVRGSPVSEVVKDESWLQGEFISTVQKRGAAVIAARGLSSAASAARAITDHMRAWALGTAEGEVVSMGVYTTGQYGVTEGLIYSMPVTCAGGNYTVKTGLEISEFAREKLTDTEKELQAEKETSTSFLGIRAAI